MAMVAAELYHTVTYNRARSHMSTLTVSLSIRLNLRPSADPAASPEHVLFCYQGDRRSSYETRCGNAKEDHARHHR